MINLSGDWKYLVGGGTGKAGTITQKEGSTLFYMKGFGNDGIAAGQVVTDTQLLVSFPFDELTGTVNSGATQISWSNGQVYARM